MSRSRASGVRMLTRPPRLRGLLMTGQRGILQTVPLEVVGQEASHVIPTALLYSLDLEGGEAHTLTAVIPFAIPVEMHPDYEGSTLLKPSPS